MPKVIIDMTMSLDGYVAGPNDGKAHPLGEHDGMRIFDWYMAGPMLPGDLDILHPAAGVDREVVDEMFEESGAFVFGRRTYDITNGWDGRHPVNGVPVFVLTHHLHDPIDMEGGTTFYFVDGFETALAEAAKHAHDRPIDIAGGASAVRQALQARCLNELVLDIVPVVLRDGERIFDDAPEFHAEAVEAATSPLATHIVYKIT